MVAGPQESHLGRVALVVEDEPMIALDVEAMLQAVGFETVLTAMTLDEARSRILQNSITFAVLDMRIVDETTAAIADLLIARETPFVFASGYGDTKSLPEALRSQPVLTKPLTESALEAAVRKAGIY